MTANHHIPDHIPDLLLERYRLNELPPADAAGVAEQLGRDARLRERLAALEQSDDMLREHIVRMEPRLIAQRPPDRRGALWTTAWAIPAVVVIASVTVAVVARRPAPVTLVTPVTPFTGPASDDRVKGASSSAPGLALYRRTAGGSERLADGAVAHTGDLIRVGYRAAGRPYGLIVSIDGAGGVTMHLPPAGDRAAALKDGATVLLDQAYELDEAPRWEQFYFIAGRTAFDVAPVVRAARDAASARTGSPPAGLALPRGLEQVSFTLQKESRP
jgi:hypothetical protein